MDISSLMNDDGDVGILDFVVKVVMPMFSVDTDVMYSVVDEARSFEYKIRIGELPELDEAMIGCKSKYFGAAFLPDPESDGQLLALNPRLPLEDQGW